MAQRTDLEVRVLIGAPRSQPCHAGQRNAVRSRPVMAKATFERLGYVFPFQAKPSASTTTRCMRPFHSRSNTCPASVLRFAGPIPRRAALPAQGTLRNGERAVSRHRGRLTNRPEFDRREHETGDVWAVEGAL